MKRDVAVKINKGQIIRVIQPGKYELHPKRSHGRNLGKRKILSCLWQVTLTSLSLKFLMCGIRTITPTRQSGCED